MEISATELKNKLGYYLDLSKSEDIYITKNGKISAKLSNPIKSPVDELTGILSHVDEDPNTLEEKRLEYKYGLFD